MRNDGFTLIELMVATVIGLATVTSVYSLGAAMSKQFYEEQRVATSQGASRVAIMELRRDISRAGLFGSPNGTLEPTCGGEDPKLPMLNGPDGDAGAFQYYADEEKNTIDEDGVNPQVTADRLRILTSLYLTDQLLVESVSADGTVILLNSGTQAYRRTFAWGNSSTAFTNWPPKFLGGTLSWDDNWAGETASWKGVSQHGARAFQTGSLLHIESPSGQHFFRTAFGKSSNVQNQIRLKVDKKLPVDTACLPGAGQNSMIAPLQWVEYAVVDPTQVSSVEADFFDLSGVFYDGTDSPSHPLVNTLVGTGADKLIEAPNRVLVRRILDAESGDIKFNTTQVIAEFVSNFRVSFLMDNNTTPPSISANPITGTTAQTSVNSNPEDVRAVIIELGVRTPLEDPNLPFDSDAGTRFDVHADRVGSARVRNMRIEIPVMNVARRNL